MNQATAALAAVVECNTFGIQLANAAERSILQSLFVERLQMLRRLLRSRSSGEFRARSPDRDRFSDNETISSVGKAIDRAIEIFAREKEGLERRIQDAESRASITAGNNYDEYLTREDTKTRALSGFEAEMINGRRRLKVLDQKIADLRFLKIAYTTRFETRLP